ncbi:MAG TPA: hypothetical protein PK441_11255 [Burkholderiaceae bacterium]|nr:hypothetical protein [Burkholderiaceae bacterium]
MTDANNKPAVVGQVERPVRPAAEARWYCLSREGMATLCTDEEDAKEVAAESFVLYPQNGPYRAVQMVDSAHVTDLLAALQWYADGMHFDKASPDAWDTVSGEPQNWWCDEAGTATVEDGSIAAMTLRGELTAAQIQALDEGDDQAWDRNAERLTREALGADVDRPINMQAASVDDL